MRQFLLSFGPDTAPARQGEYKASLGLAGTYVA